MIKIDQVFLFIINNLFDFTLIYIRIIYTTVNQTFFNLLQGRIAVFTFSRRNIEKLSDQDWKAVGNQYAKLYTGSGFPIRREGIGVISPAKKVKTCLPFCENFQYFLPNFLKPHGKSRLCRVKKFICLKKIISKDDIFQNWFQLFAIRINCLKSAFVGQQTKLVRTL